MRILQVGGSGGVGTARMGPISTTVCMLSNHLARLGHDVTLADAASSEPRELISPDVRLVEIPVTSRQAVTRAPGGRIGRALFSWATEWRMARALAIRLRGEDFEIVHLHEMLQAFFLERLYPAVSVYSSHTPTWCGGYRMGRLWPDERGVISRARLAITRGDFLRRYVSHPNMVTIPQGLDLGEWPAVESTDARRRLGLPASEFIVTFAGRLVPLKGVDVLIDAIRILKGQSVNVSAIILGPLTARTRRSEETIPYARSLIERSTGLSIQFTGYINNRSSTFRDHLAAADVFVLPSWFDAQGVVVLEAMAMGTPVIGSDVGGIPEMITDSVGRLCAPGDSHHLAHRIREFYEHPDLRQTLASRCRAHVAAFKTVLPRDRRATSGLRAPRQ